MKKRTLEKKVRLGCAVAIVSMSLILSIFGGCVYYNGKIDSYQNSMMGILNYVMLQIDADDLERCIETGKKSPNFEAVQTVMDELKETQNIDYLYIIKPLNDQATDNVMNVMAGATKREKELEADTLARLGELTGDAYSQKAAKAYLNKLHSKDGGVTYLRTRTEYGYDYTAMVNLCGSTGEPVAVLAVDISMNAIMDVLKTYIYVTLAYTLAQCALFLFGTSYWLNRQVVRPISLIQQAARNFVHRENNEDLSLENLNIQSGDEIQDLSESLVAMTKELQKYMEDLVRQTREKERIGTELALAAKIQAEMLPCIFPAFPEQKEFTVHATMTPAKEVGGDFYDFFLVDDRHLAVVMADVSGKGVPAALFMVIGKTLIKDHTKPEVPLSEVFAQVNNMLCEANSEGLFITAFEGVLDLETGLFRFVNAGHEPPFLCKKGVGFELQKIRPGFVLAGMEDMRFREGSLQLDPGDRIFLYTDGVTEATNAGNQLYGMDRLRNSLNQAMGERAADVLSRVKEDVDAFVGEAPQFDDLTMLCLDYFGKEGV